MWNAFGFTRSTESPFAKSRRAVRRAHEELWSLPDLWGRAFSRLHHELDVQEGSLTPAQQERLILLASWMPFARACEMMTRLLGVQVSEATTRRHTYTAGTAYETVQTAQASEQAAPVESSAVPAPMMVSPDGAFVPLVGGVWGKSKRW